MKSVKTGVVVLAAAMVVAGAAYGLDLGSTAANKAKDAAHAGGKMGVEKQINSDLAKKNCGFKPKTTDLTCDLSDIINTLKNEKSVAEQSGFANDVQIYAKVGQGKDPKNANLGSQRTTKVQTELIKKVSWWSWYDSAIDGDSLELSVKIK
jgi:hypothetical protein